MKVTIVEGTPEEILRAFPTLSPHGAMVVEANETLAEAAPAEDTRDRGYGPAEMARRVLRRRELSVKQRQLLLTIYKAYPDRVLASELQRQLGYTTAQFAGLMGAFGRRVSHTRGWRANDWFFMQDWDYDAGCYSYGLPESVREAMRLEQLV